VSKGYDMLRREGLLRIGRKSGAVVRRDPASGPPEDPALVSDWAARLRTLLAEAAAHGMSAAQIRAQCEAAIAGFAFPSTTGPSTTGPSTTGPSTTGPSTTGPSTVGFSTGRDQP
jgi:GntR family transcriptional regulator